MNQQDKILEKKINRILFHICLVITIIAMAMMLIEFFSRGQFPPTKIGLFYVGILLIYSIHKEALRWVEKEYQERRGELLVYLWIVVTTILYIVNFFTKDYFMYSPSGQDLSTLSVITLTALEVCGVFILARISKILALHLFKK